MVNYSLLRKSWNLLSPIWHPKRMNSLKTQARILHASKTLVRRDEINFMFSMGGGSLNYELMEHFSYDPKVATSSAFIQQRDKLHKRAFQFLLNEFTLYQGYRLVAVDGSDLLISHDPSDQQTYFQSTPNSKGFNLVHVNAMYDLCNKIYLDACIQPGRNQNELRH